MSIKYKIPLLILVFFLINILFIGLYYKLSFSEAISKRNDSNQRQIEIRTKEIVDYIQAKEDYQAVLEEIAREEKLSIQVKTLQGELIFKTVDQKGNNFNLNTMNVFQNQGQNYLIKVTKPLSLIKAPTFSLIYDLFIAEFLIIFVTLLLAAIIIHVKSVKPIMKLQQNMQQYKTGEKPKRTCRRDEIGLLQNGYVDLLDILEEEKQLQYRIVASISHDIKTPLTSVMGYAEQLNKDHISKERLEKYIHTIYAKSQVIKDIVDEFDDYVSLNMQPGLKRQKLSIQQLCTILQDDYLDELNSLNIGFEIECQCPDKMIEVDIVKINRVFGNLIGNSIKYAKDRDFRIQVRVTEQEKLILFQVSDNGMGVNTEELDKIFEPFYTSDESRRVAGLGLSICKSLIENHGGMIWAENNSWGGLTVNFFLTKV